MKIYIIGGSASSKIGLTDKELTWPQLLRDDLKDIAKIEHISQGGLTFVQAIALIENIPNCDLLILHFGTSIGWPMPLVKIGHLFGLNVKNEFALHQPLKKVTNLKFASILRFMKFRFRNLVKYLMFLIGLYRPKVSYRELDDQIDMVLKSSKHKANKIIWIQHTSFQSHRTSVERHFYSRYFKRISELLYGKMGKNLIFFEYSKLAHLPQYYLYDSVHLSEFGHKFIAEEISKLIRAV